MFPNEARACAVLFLLFEYFCSLYKCIHSLINLSIENGLEREVEVLLEGRKVALYVMFYGINVHIFEQNKRVTDNRMPNRVNQ